MLTRKRQAEGRPVELNCVEAGSMNEKARGMRCGLQAYERKQWD